jgi:hypothetical protein
MQLTQLARSLAALAGVAVAAAALFLGVQLALVAAGVAEWAAYPTAVGVVLPPVLAFADAYTPFGNTERTAALRDRPVGKLVADGALAAAVGGVVGYGGSVLLLSGDASGLLELVVVSAAVVAGYATFIGRNLDVYSDGQTDPEPAEEFQP